MPSSLWDLSLAELIYFSPSIIPVVYCLWKHRYLGLGCWFYMTAFLTLQIVGNALVLSTAGTNGYPSSTALIIANVGISPLMLSIADGVHEWTKLSGLLRTERSKKIAQIVVLLYHVAIVISIAIYAVGASKYLSEGTNEGVWETGIALLFLFWLVLCFAFLFLLSRIGIHTLRVLSFPLLFSLAMLGCRLVYQLIATFNHDRGEYNMVTGSIALRVIFEFLPGAFILVAMVVGGVMSLEHIAAAREVQESRVEMETGRVEVGDLADPPSKFVKRPVGQSLRY